MASNDNETAQIQTRRRKRPRVALESRKRAVVACTNCRRLKEKCDGRIPCERCLHHKRTCVRQPVDQHEDAASSEDRVDSERITYLERIARHFLGDICLDTASLSDVVTNLQSGSTDSTPVFAGHEPGRITPTTIKQKPRQAGAQPLNGLSDPAFESQLYGYVNKRLVISGHTEIDASHDYNELNEKSPLHKPLQLDWDVLPPREVAIFLCSAYFDHAQTVTAFADTHRVSENVTRLYDLREFHTSQDAAWICIVLAILAIGAQFSHMAGEPQPPPNSPGRSSTTQELTEEANIGLMLYHAAIRLLPDAVHLWDDDTAQAALLLAQLASCMDLSHLARTYLHICISLPRETSNGKHSNDFTMSAQDIASAWLKRLDILYADYCSDNGVYTGTSSAAVAVLGCADDEQNFAKTMLRLSDWLERFSQILSTIRDRSMAGWSSHRELLLRTRKDYQQWWSTLSTSETPILQFDQRHAHLHLYYHLNIIFMGRQFIFSTNGDAATRTFTPSTFSMVLIFAREAEYAAYQIIDICSMLDRTYKLTAANYIEREVCAAVVMVMLARGVVGRCELFHEKMELGLGLYKKMATSQATQDRARHMEAISAAISKINSQPHVNGAAALHQSSTWPRTYSLFRKWAKAMKTKDTLAPGASAERSSNGDADFTTFDDIDWNLFYTQAILADGIPLSETWSMDSMESVIA